MSGQGRGEIAEGVAARFKIAPLIERCAGRGQQDDGTVFAVGNGLGVRRRDGRSKVARHRVRDFTG